MRYRCCYRRAATVLAGTFQATVEQLATTHAAVHEPDAPNKEVALQRMDAGGWTAAMRKQMEARIEQLGVGHLSMTVGDVLEDVDARCFYFCASFSWELLRDE